MTTPAVTLPRRPLRTLPALPALRAGVRPPPPATALVRRRPRTLAEEVEPFLFWLAGVRGRRPATLRAYRRDLRCFAAFAEAAGVTTPAAVTYQLVELYLAWLRETGARQASTAARRLSALRTCFRYLRREGTVPTDPTAVVEGPRWPRQRLPAYLTVPEQERVLAALAADPTLRGRRDHAVVATLLGTGLRAAEACALQLGHLDLEAGVLRVVQGKGGRDREVPVPPRLARVLTGYLHEVRPRLHADAARASAVFLRLRPHRGGAATPLGRQGLFWIVRTRVSALVGRRVGPHALRHSYASRLRAAGADLQLIQECLGHASITTTTIYAHLSTPARLATVARLLEGP